MIRNLGRFLVLRSKVSGLIISSILFGLVIVRGGSEERIISVDRYDQSINSERFRLSVSDLYIPPTNRLCNRREMNHAECHLREGRGSQIIKEKEIIRNLGRLLFLRFKFSVSFLSLELMITREIGGTHDKSDYPDQPRTQPKREMNHTINHSGRKGRQKSTKFLVMPPAQKISEILELLIFLKEFSDILEPLRSPQEAF